MASLKLESQFLVIYAEQVKHSRVQVVHADWILGDVVTEVISFSVAESLFDTCSRHPDGEATGMVISAVVGGCEFAL